LTNCQTSFEKAKSGTDDLSLLHLDCRFGFIGPKIFYQNFFINSTSCENLCISPKKPFQKLTESVIEQSKIQVAGQESGFFIFGERKEVE